MTREHRTRPHHGAERGAAFEKSRAALPKKKPFKIVLEAVTQEKRKLRSIMTYTSNAPVGFGFIPAGHPDFTEWCKEQCRQRNLDVHIVSAKPRSKLYTDPEKLSHHVHRVGYHFPLEIINLACTKFGYLYSEQSGLKKARARDRANWIEQHVENYSSRQMQHGRSSTAIETKEYIQGAVREMFPKIPEADLVSIVNHAFQEGTNRVGNAKELSLARRVQLAVLAHIRHVYTDYDKLLKTGGWLEARQKVESVSLAKLKEWRDETGEDSNELEETFREVIVLDDDDDDTSSDEDAYSPRDREPSMEIVSDRATAQDLQPGYYVDNPRPDENGTGRVSRRTILLQPYAPPTARAPHVSDQALFSRNLPSENRPRFPMEGIIHAHSIPTDSRAGPPVPITVHRSKEPLLREINGQLYHLEPIEDSDDHSRIQRSSQLRTAPHHSQQGYVPPPTRMSLDRPPPSRHNSDQDVVIPSVEHESAHAASPRYVGSTQRQLRAPNPPPQGYIEIQSPKRKAYPGPEDNRNMYLEQDIRRLKPVYSGHELQPRVCPHQSDSFQPIGVRERPPHSIIDLTSSPEQARVGDDRGRFIPARPHPPYGAPDHIYAPQPSYALPLRDERGAYFESPVAGRAYVSDHRSYERPPPPPRDYSPRPRPPPPLPPPPREYVPIRYERQRQLFERGAR